MQCKKILATTRLTASESYDDYHVIPCHVFPCHMCYLEMYFYLFIYVILIFYFLIFTSAIMRQPVYSGCCKMVQACKVCADEWFRNSPQCMKCRAADGKENLQEIRGLSMEWIKDLLD